MSSNTKKFILADPIYQRVLSYIKPYWKFGLLGLIATIIYSFIDVAAVGMIKPLVNKIWIDKNLLYIKWAPIVIFVGFSLRGVTSFFSTYFMTFIARKVVLIFRKQIFSHYLKLPALYYDQTSSGKLLSKLLYDTEQVAQVSMDAFTTLIQSFFMVIGLFIAMLYFSWPLTCIFLVVVPIIAAIVKITSRKMRKKSILVQQTMMGVTDTAEEAIEGYREVRVFGGEKYEENKFHKVSTNNFIQDMKFIFIKAINVSGVQIIASIAISFIISLAVSSSRFGLDAGSFAGLITAMVAILKPLKNLSTVNSTIQRGLAGAQSVFELLDTETEPNFGTEKIEKCKGLVEFKDLSFSYPNTKKAVLKDINMIINPGKVIALVGKSGSGKSTLISLIPRFYEIVTGEITVDGINIKDIELSALRAQIGLISQNTVLFNDTILNNIAYSELDNIDKEKAYKAADQAYVLEFANNLENGLNSMVGENGVLLSGGQKQRISLARAIYKNAPIFILDEATSALDTESEKYIQKALHEVMAKKTTIVIAHRLSTIENADQIIVMDNGQIVESGTHRELLDHDGYYAHLYKIQFDNNENNINKNKNYYDTALETNMA